MTENEVDSSIEDLTDSKQLNVTDTKVPYIVSLSKEDSVLDETIEEKKFESYNRSIR